jgi:hypothetical protein
VLVCDRQLNRREAIALAGLSTAALVGGTADVAAAPLEAVEVAPGLSIFTRSSWGADLPPKGALLPETPKFLLVHHTASTNSYSSAANVIRSTYAWQTSPAKGWNDVCYNFFVGRDGDVWEGRAGSLGGPIMADATGGSQGFAQLVCLLGDFSAQAPTVAAEAALIKVLAWLAGRYTIDVSPGAATTFVSRGSQRWAAGVEVTTATVSVHRDMSYTECPGDGVLGRMPAIREAAFTQLQGWASGLKPAVRLGVVS